MSLRQRKKAATRTAIADAASRLFEAHGFDNVSIEVVARTAGVSRQTVFNYFHTKEDLVFDRADEVRERMVAAVRGRGARSPIDAVRAFTRAFWERFAALPDDRPQAGFFSIVDSTRSLQAYSRELNARTVAEMAEVLREQMRAGPDDPAPFVLASALGAVHFAVFDAAQRRIVGGDAPRAFVPGLLADADRAFDRLRDGFR
jgi:AcrR family transcriptional regulator